MENKQADFLQKVQRITFEQFKQMARDENLSLHEKIGFPDNYRESYTKEILQDITAKVACLEVAEQKIADIGCGCDQLAQAIIDKCHAQHHELYLFDSAEMLELLPDYPTQHKIVGKFPQDREFVDEHSGYFNAIIIYSVMQHVVLEDNPYTFIDMAVKMLAPGGVLLLGDLPNRSKRKRFFLSPKGIKTHQEYTSSQDLPKVDLLNIETEQIDDSIVFSILQRYRSAGLETYLMPQGAGLPMATRREDIVIVKPC